QCWLNATNFSGSRRSRMQGSFSVGYRNSVYPPTGTCSSALTRIASTRPAMARFHSLRPAATNVPAKNASDVSPRNFVNSRRVTKLSSSDEIGKSLDIGDVLCDVRHYVEVHRVHVRRHHHVHFRPYDLLAESNVVDRP